MTGYPSLFEQFLHEECTANVRELIRNAAAESDQGQARREFEFNRFNLSLDFESGTATIEDETDVSEKGSVSIALSELLDRIGR
jgi:hypothetical protein